MKSRKLAIGAALCALVVGALASGCAFEVCCMRPATGLYDVCFQAAAPTKLAPPPDADDAWGAPRAEVAPVLAPLPR